MYDDESHEASRDSPPRITPSAKESLSDIAWFQPIQNDRQPGRQLAAATSDHHAQGRRVGSSLGPQRHLEVADPAEGSSPAQRLGLFGWQWPVAVHCQVVRWLSARAAVCLFMTESSGRVGIRK